MAITVGQACSDRSALFGSDYTLVNQSVSAGAAGTIDYLCIWTDGVSDPLHFGLFSASGNDLTLEDSAEDLTAILGKNEYNAPGDFTAMSVSSGECIGAYVYGCGIEKDNSGTSIWFTSGDKIKTTPANSTTFTSSADRPYSIYATGTEAGAGAAPTGGLYGSLVGPFGGPMGPMGGKL